MTTRVWVPCDSAAISVGADDVAAAITREAAARGMEVELLRNGSRGLFWLEPLVEVETAIGRTGYGPASPEDVPGLFEAGFLAGAQHALAVGQVEGIEYLRKQSRLTFANCGRIEPLSLAAYIEAGGFEGLKRAVSIGPKATIEAVAQSGLRGRGGAGFPTGVKWEAAATAPGEPKYVVCNADEGDSGTYADRMLMEGDPFAVIEGMAIAGFAVGATQGYVYIRSEYPSAFATMQRALEIAHEAGWLGTNVGGLGFAFDIDVRLGAGAYICGEESSLVESLEGKRGVIRARPPLPVHSGLFGRPTVVNNLVTLATVPWIILHGAEAYAELGVGRSRGTLTVQLAGNLMRTGLVEVPFGATIRELIEGFGGGTHSGRPLRAVQIGGPLGAYFPPELLDTPLDYEALAAAGGLLGHGGIVVFDNTVDLAAQARFAMEFCAAESCGKCTPCRIGSTRGVEVLDRITAGVDRVENLILLEDLCEVLTDGSLCQLGGLIPFPVRSALRHFPEDFDRLPALAGTEGAPA